MPSCPATHTPGWTGIIPQTEIHPDKPTERTQHRTDPAHMMDEGKEERGLKVEEKTDLEQDTERVKMRQRALDRWHTMTAGDDNDWL